MLGEGTKSHIESRCDGTAAEDAVFPDDIEGRRCSKIHGDDRQRIMCGSPGCINEAVAAYFFRFRDGKCHAEITFGCDEQRFCAEQITDTFLQKRQNRRNTLEIMTPRKSDGEKFLSLKSCSSADSYWLADQVWLMSIRAVNSREYACCGAVRTPPSVTVVFPISIAKIIKIPRADLKVVLCFFFIIKPFCTDGKHDWL